MLKKLKILLLRNKIQVLKYEFEENGLEIKQFNKELQPPNSLTAERRLAVTKERAWLLRRQKELQNQWNELLLKISELEKE